MPVFTAQDQQSLLGALYMAKPFLLKLNKDEVKLKYDELGTIKSVALFYQSSPSTMKRYFRRHNIFYTKKHKKNFDEDFFSYNTLESFYLSGFIAADGNISKIKNRLTIALAEKDLLFLEKIKHLIKYEGSLYKYVVKNSKRNIKWKDSIYYALSCSSKRMAEYLSKFNIIPAKTKTYNMPDWLINHPYINHFMRGYFDGDGHLGLRENKKLRWHLSGNYFFIKNFQSVLEKMCNIHHNQIIIRPNGLCCLEYQGTIIVPKICKFLYNNSTFHLDRKYDIYYNVVNNKAY